MPLDVGGGSIAQSHELYVVFEESHFLADGYHGVAGPIDAVAQQVAQLLNALLATVSINLTKTGNVVERVEEEVRVQLILQPGQFRLGVPLAFLR